MIKHLSYEERLGETELFSLEKAQGYNQLHKYLKGGCEEAKLFSLVPCNNTRCNGQNQNIRKLFLTVRVAKHWNKLPRKAVDFLSLEILKSCLYMVLGN